MGKTRLRGRHTETLTACVCGPVVNFSVTLCHRAAHRGIGCGIEARWAVRIGHAQTRAAVRSDVSAADIAAERIGLIRDHGDNLINRLEIIVLANREIDAKAMRALRKVTRRRNQRKHRMTAASANRILRPRAVVQSRR